MTSQEAVINQEKENNCKPYFEPYTQIEELNEPTIKTGNKNLDDWWSKDGGIVKKSSIFVTGTSGAGKTTLSVNLMKLLEDYKFAFYSREMHRSSVKEQTKDVGVKNENALVADFETCPHSEDFIKLVKEEKPTFIIIDSLQAACAEDFPKMSDEDAHIYLIKKLQKWIFDNNAILFIIGHNTKDNEFRGSNTIMQYMDAHMHLVHYKKEDYRTISWEQKNRKGPQGMLYYTINEDTTLSFYTEEEWVNLNGNLELCDYIDSAIDKFLVPFKNKEGYNKFKKEVNNHIESIEENKDLTNIEYYTQILKIIDELSKKYGFVNNE